MRYVIEYDWTSGCYEIYAEDYSAYFGSYQSYEEAARRADELMTAQ